MRKESFLVFHESKRLGESGQGHLEKAEGVFENNVASVDGQRHDFGAIDDLVWDNILSIEFIQDQVRIEPLRVVR